MMIRVVTMMTRAVGMPSSLQHLSWKHTENDCGARELEKILGYQVTVLLVNSRSYTLLFLPDYQFLYSYRVIDYLNTIFRQIPTTYGKLVTLPVSAIRHSQFVSSLDTLPLISDFVKLPSLLLS